MYKTLCEPEDKVALSTCIFSYQFSLNPISHKERPNMKISKLYANIIKAKGDKILGSLTTDDALDGDKGQ